MAEVVRNVSLDEGERAVEAREHVIGVDVRPSVVDDNRDAAHQMTGNPSFRRSLAEDANQIGQHLSDFN
jgi:hypothetical protein